MREIKSSRAPEPIGPYSQAVKSGNFVFVSGQIPLQEDGSLLKAPVEEQTRLVFKNIEGILKEAGAFLADIVKISVFLNNIDYFQSVNKVFEELLAKPYPARETVEVSRLPKGADIEISVIASTLKKK